MVRHFFVTLERYCFSLWLVIKSYLRQLSLIFLTRSHCWGQRDILRKKKVKRFWRRVNSEIQQSDVSARTTTPGPLGPFWPCWNSSYSCVNGWTRLMLYSFTFLNRIIFVQNLTLLQGTLILCILWRPLWTKVAWAQRHHVTGRCMHLIWKHFLGYVCSAMRFVRLLTAIWWWWDVNLKFSTFLGHFMSS